MRIVQLHHVEFGRAHQDAGLGNGAQVIHGHGNGVGEFQLRFPPVADGIQGVFGPGIEGQQFRGQLPVQ